MPGAPSASMSGEGGAPTLTVRRFQTTLLQRPLPKHGHETGCRPAEPRGGRTSCERAPQCTPAPCPGLCYATHVRGQWYPPGTLAGKESGDPAPAPPSSSSSSNSKCSSSPGAKILLQAKGQKKTASCKTKYAREAASCSLPGSDVDIKNTDINMLPY